MLADTAEPFDSDKHLFEPKWDGFRCLAYIENSLTKLQSRNGFDLTRNFPELSLLHRHIATPPAIVDGEIIILQGDRESFHLLLERLRQRPKAMLGVGDVPALFVAFDILYVQGESVTHCPLEERKALLTEASDVGEHFLVNIHIYQDGKRFFQAAVAQGREGIMAKRLDSPYLPGKRSRHWLKIKPLRTIEAVVLGYIPKGKGGFSSLVLGQYHPDRPSLVCIGNVGTGFSEEAIGDILERLEPIGSDNALPIALPDNLKSVVWVKPNIVVEISYLEYTSAGNLRHPSFRCIRLDIEPQDCFFPHTSQT